MPNEVLLYGPITSDSSADFINQCNLFDDSEATVRVNTPGGDVAYTWGMVIKFAELANKKRVVVDGQAYSGGAYFCAYADEAECYDVSQFLLHRAAYWFEGYPEIFDDASKTSLANINAKLKKVLAAKIDTAKLKELKGVTLNDIFSMDDRLDVFLNADEAKQIGLVSKINKITPAKKAEIKAQLATAMATYTGAPQAAAPVKPISENSKKPNMTLAELKTSHPALYAEVLALGKTEGIKAERDRVGSFMEFYDSSPEKVAKAISEGTEMNLTLQSAFLKASVQKDALAKLGKESAGEVTTDENAANAAADKDKTSDAAVMANLAKIEKERKGQK